MKNVCFLVAIVNTQGRDEIFHMAFVDRKEANRVFKRLDEFKKDLEDRDKLAIHFWGPEELDMLNASGHLSSHLTSEDTFVKCIKALL